MRTLRFLNLAVLPILVSSWVYAQDAKPQDHPQQEQPRQGEPRQAEPQPDHQQRPDDMKPRQDETKPPNQDNDKNDKSDKKENRQSHEQMKPGGANGEQARRGRPAGKSAHIPEDKFRQHFGRQHTVVISRPVIVEGRPRFQAVGYWFEIVDPWPAEWAYTDEVYVDYIDGEYFLFDVLHPGVRIALFVTM